MDRPLGLLTRTDIAFLASALNAAVESANGLEEVFGPAMVINRATLDRVMHATPTDNVYEWIDEQVGWLLKFGAPCLTVTRIEDGVDPERKGGYILSVPAAPEVSAATLKNVSAAVANGHPVVALGRADYVHPDLLAMLGVSADQSDDSVGAGPLPAYYGNATLLSVSPNGALPVGAPAHQIISLSPRVSAKVVDASKGRAFLTVGGALVAVADASGAPMAWAQLNDWRNGAGEDIGVNNVGTVGGFQTLALIASGGGSGGGGGNSTTSAAVAITAGVNATHPGTMLAWRSHGTAKILLGNLEGVYCGGATSGPYSYSDGCAIPLDSPTGGWVGGTWLELRLKVSPVLLGVGHGNGSTGTCSSSKWRLRAVDGQQPTRSAVADADGTVEFTVVLGPREAHTFELLDQSARC